MYVVSYRCSKAVCVRARVTSHCRSKCFGILQVGSFPLSAVKAFEFLGMGESGKVCEGNDLPRKD